MAKMIDVFEKATRNKLGEVCYTGWPRLFPAIPIANGMRSLQKLRRVS